MQWSPEETMHRLSEVSDLSLPRGVTWGCTYFSQQWHVTTHVKCSQPGKFPQVLVSRVFIGGHLWHRQAISMWLTSATQLQLSPTPSTPAKKGINPNHTVNIKRSDQGGTARPRPQDTQKLMFTLNIVWLKVSGIENHTIWAEYSEGSEVVSQKPAKVHS